MNADPRRCDQYRELLSALLDGDVTPEERAQLANHLVGCAECRAQLDAYRAIGMRIRALPAAQAPADLTDAIYAATIDAEPRRLFVLTSKLGYSLAAVAAVALMFLVAGYLLVGSYQRGVTPQVAASQPDQNVTWSIYKPIRISFNKPMNHQSVEDALAIQPLGEEDRLNISWDGNTLVIGLNQNLIPNSDYSVRITTDARDKYGHRLGSAYTLQFATTPSVALEDTPTATAPAPTERAVVPPANPTATPSGNEPSPTSAAPATATTTMPDLPLAPSPSATAANPGNPPAGPGPGNGGPTATPTPLDDAQPTPTPAVTDDAPTPTVAPPADTPTPTPSPTPTAPAPTPTPTVAAPTPTVAAPTETPTTIPVTGDLGSVYWSNADVQQRLGAPTAAATSSTNQVLGFQHGNMYLRGDTNEIYVMVQYGGWDRFANTATTDPPSQPGPDQDTWIPGGAFGVLWSSESSVSDELGYAGSDSATIFTGEFQQFEGGVMLSTPTDVLMFYNDGTWDWLPIVSDSGATTTP